MNPYSVSFQLLDGTYPTMSGGAIDYSTWPTIQAAKRHLQWLAKQSFARSVSLWRGQPGECLIERWERK